MREREQPPEPQVIVESDGLCIPILPSIRLQDSVSNNTARPRHYLRCNRWAWSDVKNAYQLSTQRPLRRHKQRGSPLDKSASGRLLLEEGWIVLVIVWGHNNGVSLFCLSCWSRHTVAPLHPETKADTVITSPNESLTGI